MVSPRVGIARNQTGIFCLEDFIAPDNMVRVIDAFVDILDFESLGFANVQPKQTGAPAFHPALLMKIYIYGYLNRVRSSRKLEKECERNIEMKWLCNSQVPCYHSISTFRTLKKDIFDEKGKKIGQINHSKALKEVFRSLNRFLNGEELFGKEDIASDGTKIRAQNAKKKNFTHDKLTKKIELSDAEIDRFLSDLERSDSAENTENGLINGLGDTENAAKLAELQKWNTRYKGFKVELERRMAIDNDITQISLTDPDARSIVLNNSGHSEVAYNIVTAADGKNCLIADFFVDNVKDTSLLAQSLIACKAELDNDFSPDLHQNKDVNKEIITEADEAEGAAKLKNEPLFDNLAHLKSKLNPETTINGLADKGFHSAAQLHEAIENGIVTYVAIPEPAYSGKDKNFTVANFLYDEKNDNYTCPKNNKLNSSGKFYDKKDKKGQVSHRFRIYRLPFETCANCPFFEKCLSPSDQQQRQGRKIERMEHQDASDQNKARMTTKEGKALYKRRQAIVEHPFGTIKRQWDCSYTLVRSKEKVEGEFSIVFTCYNLRRLMSLIPVSELLEKLKTAKSTAYAFFILIYERLFRLFYKNLNFVPFFIVAPPNHYHAPSNKLERLFCPN